MPCIRWVYSSFIGEEVLFVTHALTLLQMLAQFRFPALYGGSDDPGRIITQTIHNDTGSNIQGIYRHDWNYLNVWKLETSRTEATLASGTRPAVEFFVGQIRIVTLDAKDGKMKALTDWLNEKFVIVE